MNVSQTLICLQSSKSYSPGSNTSQTLTGFDLMMTDFFPCKKVLLMFGVTASRYQIVKPESGSVQKLRLWDQKLPGATGYVHIASPRRASECRNKSNDNNNDDDNDDNDDNNNNNNDDEQ